MKSIVDVDDFYKFIKDLNTEASSRCHCLYNNCIYRLMNDNGNCFEDDSVAEAAMAR